MPAFIPALLTSKELAVWEGRQENDNTVGEDLSGTKCKVQGYHRGAKDQLIWDIYPGTEFLDQWVQAGGGLGQTWAEGVRKNLEFSLVFSTGIRGGV